MDLEPREAADFTYVPTRPGQVMPEEWYPRGPRITLPAEVQHAA